MLIGETLAQTTSPSPSGLSQQQRRGVLVTLMGIGSNVPDLDFLSSLISGDKLEYLLEHRGHTHTVIGALIAAALLFLAFDAWCRWRKWPLTGRDRWQLAGASLLCLLLHIGMDFANNYGVHAFWPFYNGWLYGDSIFIWEPLLWTAAAPLCLLLRTRVARALVGAMLIAAIAACFGSGLVPRGFAVLMTALTVGMLLLAHRVPRTHALLGGIALWISITAAFAFSRTVVESQVKRFAATSLPQMTVLDYVLTPMPANPACWSVMLPMTDSDRYVVRHGTWSLWPAVLPADRCPGKDLFTNITAPMQPVEGDGDAMHFWHGEIEMPRDELPGLVDSYCDAAAFMHFARVPWSMRREDGWIVGDLRYDRESGLGFAELQFENNAAKCPSRQSPWIPPRSDLLR